MIVATVGGQLLVITQNDHAHFAGELLALWRSDGLPENPRRRELLFAAREHDNGWAEIDSAPMSHKKSGRPLDFTAVPRATRWDIWRRGTRRYIEREPYATLLIVRHALHLHRSQRRDPEWSDLFGEWLDLEAELVASTSIDEEAVTGDYRWIELADSLSLTACNCWTHEQRSQGFRGKLHVDDEGLAGRPAADRPVADRPVAEVTLARGAVVSSTLCIDPFPLAGTTSFRIACRVIPDRPYASDVDLGIELATARWRDYVVRVAPSMFR